MFDYDEGQRFFAPNIDRGALVHVVGARGEEVGLAPVLLPDEGGPCIAILVCDRDCQSEFSGLLEGAVVDGGQELVAGEL